MIPYEDLCRALDRYNGRRNNADEMAQLDQVTEEPTEPAFQDVAAEPAFQDVAAATDPEVALEATPEFTEAVPEYTDPTTEATLNEPLLEAEPEVFVESAPEMAPAAEDAQQPADQVSVEEPTVQAAIDMGPTNPEVFTPGSEMPYDTSTMATTAENEMPYMEQPTDVTPIEPVPEQAPMGPEETTQEFDIDEAEEVVEKEPQ